MNRRYEAYQKEKSKQFEVELAAIKTLKAQIKDEVAAARLRLEELTAVYTAEVNELYMEEAKAVQAIQQSNAGPTHLIERERIRKVIQHAHQEHFKAREIAEEQRNRLRQLPAGSPPPYHREPRLVPLQTAVWQC